jgi:hypothetical protein
MNAESDRFTEPPLQPSPAPLGPSIPPATEPKPDADERRELRRLRRVARKTLELSTADPIAVALVADLYAVGGDVADLAVEIVTNHSRATMSPLRALLRNGIDDQVELGIELSVGGRQRMRNYWRLLRSIGAASGELPASDVKAAMRIAQTVLALTDTQRGHLTAAADLARS